MKHEPFITIGEIIRAQHPELFKVIVHHCDRDVTGLILAPAELTGEEIYYARLMEEKPRPGRGG